ncbi:helix-turn-helix domain-containing protein [Salibacterium sp. K-3]
MKIKSYEFDFGKLLFFERINNQLTQKDLCHGICSITYLSKIENGKIYPNAETLALLLQRIGIEPTISSEKPLLAVESLENWYLSIVQGENSDSIYKYKKKVEKEINRIYSTDLLLYYYLVKLRYFIHTRMTKEAKEILELLKKSRDKFTSHHDMYYQYFLGLYHCILDSNFQSGLKQFEKVLPFFNDYQYLDPDYFYHIALTYTNLHRTRSAMFYIEKALTIFNEQLFISKSLECQLILSLNLGRLENYQKAIQICHNVIRVSKTLQEPVIQTQALQNLGYIYKMKHDLEHSMDYFLQALENIDSISDNLETYLTVIIELSSVLLKNNQSDEALKWLSSTLDSFGNCSCYDQIVELEVLKHQLNSSDERLIKYLEEKAIPHTLSKNKYNQTYYYYELLGDKYKQIYKYKKSSYCYKQCLEFLKEFL